MNDEVIFDMSRAIGRVEEKLDSVLKRQDEQEVTIKDNSIKIGRILLVLTIVGYPFILLKRWLFRE
jgi:hypothetical protein